MERLVALGQPMGEFCRDEHSANGIASHLASHDLRVTARGSYTKPAPERFFRRAKQALEGMVEQPRDQDHHHQIEKIE